MKVFTIWPANKDGSPATSSGAWRQEVRWLVLDVTNGLDNAKLVHGPVRRDQALSEELRLRVEQRTRKVVAA